jgi:hypothetical protein
MVDNDSKNSPEISKKRQNFMCKYCDYSTYKYSDFKKHVVTDKHKKRIEYNKMIETQNDKSQNNANYKCICGRVYKYDSGYYRHKKICDMQKKEDLCGEENGVFSVSKDELIKYLLKENEEFKNLIMEQNKVVNKIYENTAISSTINNNNINSNNKTFNLNFFLNEQCKDALNMSDFIDSIIVNMSDLENTGRVGFVEGLSKLFIKHLEKLDTHKRPIHCSDLKREILYIKDRDEWEKDNEEKEKLQRAIKEVGMKNIRQIAEWVKKYPDCRQSDSRKNDQYIRITMNSMSGSTEEEQAKNINKIISNIAKEVVIQK